MPRTDAATGAGAKLKILMLLLYYHPHPTGLTYLAQVVAEGLASRGHQITVLVARHTKETPLGETMHNGVRVVRLWAPIRISRGFVMPSYPWRLYRLLRQHDVVAMFTPMFESALGAFLAQVAGLKVVASHTSDLILPKKGANSFVTAVMFAIFRYMARRSACIISLSADYADNSAWLAPFLSKVRPVYPPIVIPEPDPESAKRLREKLRNNDGPLIGFSGRFVEEKRPELLIKSLDVVSTKYPDARIVFTGQHEIPYEDTWARHRPLMETFRAQLEFLGLLETKQELANFYAACDVFVLPSDSEGFAMAQVEAMLCGTPVVMTDIPGGRVAVQETGMGKLAQAGDWRSIGETILEVLDNRERFVKPQEKIAEIFSMDDTLDQYEAIFREFARP